MSFRKVRLRKLFGLLLIAPTASRASGEDVLVPMELDLLLLVIAVVILIVLPASWRQRAMVISTYLASILLAFSAVWNMPYSENQTFVNLLCVGGPAVVTLLAATFILKLNGGGASQYFVESSEQYFLSALGRQFPRREGRGCGRFLGLI